MNAKYAFGDSEIAAQRLGLLARVFAESTRGFVCGAISGKPELAVDLGCGPGHTTHLLAEVLQCDRVAGLDKSENFLSLAKKSETKKVSFYLHDVTSVPFPVGTADVMFCRFLLTHLHGPQWTIMKWVNELRPDGVLLTEEVERIHTQNTTFARYLEIVAAFLRDQGHRLYVGPLLDSFSKIGPLQKRESRVARLRVTNDRAAGMFALNMRSWKHLAFVRANYAREEIQELEEQLHALTNETNGKSEIEWGLRQIVFARQD